MKEGANGESLSSALSWPSEMRAELKYLQKGGKKGMRTWERGEKKEGAAWFLSVENAGRRSESSGSIYSSPRLFSFRRTFRVQQQSCRVAAAPDGLCCGNACVLSRGRLPPSFLLRSSQTNAPWGFYTNTHADTHAHTQAQTNNSSLLVENKHMSSSGPVPLSVCMSYIYSCCL